MAKDYYQILGVSRDASEDDIKKAYRKLAHQYHPDKEGGNESKFKEINEAYQVLSNAQKRARYDRFGDAAEGPGFSPGSGFDFSGFGQGFGQQGFEGFDFGDIFGEFFGGKGRRAGRAGERGRDIAVDVEITLEDAFRGAERVFELKKLDRCTRCSGNGAEPNTPIKTCPTCQGSGYLREARQTFLGTIATETVCARCRGEGKTPEKPCSACRGEGRTPEVKKISLRIPQGIRDGEMIKIAGEGEAGLTGKRAGDLYATIHVKPHPHFRRDGDDIRLARDVSFAQMALGGTVEIPTLDGTVRMEIPPGTDPGKTLRLRGKGMPRLHGRGRGDMIVEIRLQTPKKLSRRARELLGELDREMGQ